MKNCENTSTVWSSQPTMSRVELMFCGGALTSESRPINRSKSTATGCVRGAPFGEVNSTRASCMMLINSWATIPYATVVGWMPSSEISPPLRRPP